MSTSAEQTYFNKSAYVALLCLIAFVIVITICVIKQFIWDPLLSRQFQAIRPVLSESVRKLSASFSRLQSTRNSSISIQKSSSDVCITTNEPVLSPTQNLITATKSLPTNDNQYNPINKNTPQRSYGSASWNQHVYTNYGSDDLEDEQVNTPILHFSCEYNPATYSIKLHVKNLRNMNIFNPAIKSNASVLLRFTLSNKIYETTRQTYQDSIRFDETFIILNNIHPGDLLNFEIKFSIVLIIDDNSYEIAEAIHSMKDDCLTYVLFVERTLLMDLKLIKSEAK